MEGQKKKHIIKQASESRVELESTFKNNMTCDFFHIQGTKVGGHILQRRITPHSAVGKLKTSFALEQTYTV